jgi:large subunit ribosomal protein L10
MPSVKNIESVKNVTEKFKKASAMYFADYKGLDVSAITQLRKDCFANNVDLTVAKNTIIKIAAKEVGIEGLEEILSGQTAVALSYDDPTNPAKVIKNFKKEFEKPEIKGLIINGEIFGPDQFDRIASLPSKEQLLSKLIGMLQSPMSKLSATLSSPLSGFLGTLEQIKSKKGS